MRSRSITVAGARFLVDLDGSSSRRLSTVRRKRTAPEQRIRDVLVSLGEKFSRNTRSLPGSPDFVSRAEGWALFVHGCFWHHHSNCRRASVPTRNRKFWEAKFVDNRRRDAAAVRRLRALGFRTLTVWECMCKDERRVARVVATFLEESRRAHR